MSIHRGAYAPRNHSTEIADTRLQISSGYSGQGRSSTSGTRCPLPPCGSSSGPLDPRESGRHRTPPTAADHRVSPATAALAASHLRPPGASIPPWCACLRPSMSSGAFRLLTAASTDGSSASGHMPLSAGGSKSSTSRLTDSPNRADKCLRGDEDHLPARALGRSRPIPST